MPLRNSCPSEAQLHRLLAGGLPESDVAPLARHRDACLSCRAPLYRLAGLDRGKDFLAARLRDRSLNAGPAFRRVMADLRDQPPGSTHAFAPPEEPVESPPAPVPQKVGHYEVRSLIGEG